MKEINFSQLIPEVKELKVQDLILSYKGGFTLKVENLAFKPGLYTLLGPNGAGKTTLLNVIAGLAKPSKGSVIANDLVNIYGLARSQRLEFLRKHYSYLIQEDILIEHLSVKDNILLFYHLSREAPPLELLDRIASDLQIGELLERKPSQLSGGERRKVGIARALVKAFNGASVILLDEPTSNLDSDSVVVVKEYLVRLARDGKIVIVATHDQALAEIADSSIAMRAGRIISF